MAHRLIWSEAAVADLESIAEYIERDSPHYAAAVVQKILDLADALPAHPLSGRMVPEFAREDVRERFVYSYRLIYQVQPASLIVINVIHGRRNYDPGAPVLRGQDGG